MKAILVIDMPDSCMKCPLKAWDDEDDWIGCHLNVRQTGTWSEQKADKPLWCPLKPLPKKKTKNKQFSLEYAIMWCRGYNKCIDEILGEQE